MISSEWNSKDEEDKKETPPQIDQKVSEVESVQQKTNQINDDYSDIEINGILN